MVAFAQTQEFALLQQDMICSICGRRIFERHVTVVASDLRHTLYELFCGWMCSQSSSVSCVLWLLLLVLVVVLLVRVLLMELVLAVVTPDTVLVVNIVAVVVVFVLLL